MSKLDRQLDELRSVKPLVIVWHAFDDVDVLSLERQIRSAVLVADYRVPVDCRNVDGVPNELVDLLVRSNIFAREHGKQVTLAFASDELRAALRPGVHHRNTVSHELGVDAANAAAESLRDRLASKPMADAKQSVLITSVTLPSKKRRFGSKRLLKLVGIVLVGATFIGGLEWYLIFNENDTINISQFAELPQQQKIKTFENQESPNSAGLLPKEDDTR
jgi:hypothetical protein